MNAAPPTTWREIHRSVRERLGSDVDARRIVERASGREGAAWLLALDEPVPARAVPFVDDMVARRAAGEPLQYVLGRWAFRRLDLLVDRRVLIPRPETELVVDVALQAGAALPRFDPFVALDLGTGSGAIALSLAVELRVGGRDPQVWATERSAPALAVARANLAGLAGRAAPRVRLLEGSWFEPLPAELRGRVALIVANPPYVGAGEPLPAELGWEPREALVAGPTGLEAIEHIVAAAPVWLAPGGVLVLELAPHQADTAMRLAARARLTSSEVRPDLAARPRVLVASGTGAGPGVSGNGR